VTGAAGRWPTTPWSRRRWPEWTSRCPRVRRGRLDSPRSCWWQRRTGRYSWSLVSWLAGPGRGWGCLLPVQHLVRRHPRVPPSTVSALIWWCWWRRRAAPHTVAEPARRRMTKLSRSLWSLRTRCRPDRSRGRRQPTNLSISTSLSVTSFLAPPSPHHNSHKTAF